MKVGWIVTGTRETGNSARCVAINVHDWFSRNGIDSEIVFANESDVGSHVPESPEIDKVILDREVTHLVFQKVCLGYSLHYLRLAKKMGIITIYTVDDFLGQWSKDMEAEADIIVANSATMKDYVQRRYNKEAIQIPCAYESSRDFYKQNYHTEQFTVFWYGSLGNASQAQEFINLMNFLGYKYEIIGPPQLATIPWTPKFYNDLIKADVAVLPCLHKMSGMELAKGEGRPVQSMILGVPIVVSPFPTYANLITNGINGFVCYLNTPGEFGEYLEYLQDEKAREEIGKGGRQRVIDEYHIDSIGKRWIEVLK